MDAALRRQTLADLLHRSAKRFSSKTAIICGDTGWSYAEFDALCDRLAAGLAARGVGKGTRVAILARNSPRLRGAAVRAGAARRRAGADQFHAQAGGGGLHPQARRRRDAGDRLPASPRWHAPPPRSTPKCASSSGCRRRRETAPAPGMIAFDELLSNSAEPPPVDLSGSDIAQIVYTSGTESLPKGAMLTHDAVIWQYVSCIVDASIAPTISPCTPAALPLRAARCVPRSGDLCRRAPTSSPPSRRPTICCR